MSNTFTRTTLPLMIIGGLNLLAGLVFQAVVAAIYGTSASLEAFFMADAVTGFLNDRLLFGAVNLVLVPLLCEEHIRRDPDGSWHIASTFICSLTILSLLFTSICCVLAPSIVRLIAPGFEPEQVSLTVNLLRLLSLTTLFFAAGAWMRGILHANNVFIIPALGGVVYFLFLSGFTLLGFEKMGIWALCLSAVLGSALFCAFHILPLRTVFLRIRFKLDVSVLRGPLTLFFSFLLISAAAHINYVVDRYFASRLSEGSIVVLTLAQRFEIPIVFIATVSISLPALTIFSNATGNLERFRGNMRASIRAMGSITVPLLALMWVARMPLIQLCLQHGAFSYEDSLRVASVLTYLLPAFLVNAYGALVLNGYFSLRAVRLCLVIVFLEVALNFYLNRLLIESMGLEGIALATSLSVFLAAAVLWAGLRRKLEGLGFQGHLSELYRLVGFCALTASSFYVIKVSADRAFPAVVSSSPLLALALLGPIALFVFFLSGHIFRIKEVTDLILVGKNLLGATKKHPAPSDEPNR